MYRTDNCSSRQRLKLEEEGIVTGEANRSTVKHQKCTADTWNFVIMYKRYFVEFEDFWR